MNPKDRVDYEYLKKREQRIQKYIEEFDLLNNWGIADFFILDANDKCIRFRMNTYEFIISRGDELTTAEIHLVLKDQYYGHAKHVFHTETERLILGRVLQTLPKLRLKYLF